MYARAQGWNTNLSYRSQDFTLGPSRVFKSRTELDFVAYKSLPPISPRRTLNAEAGLPSLASCCIDVAAENYGDSSTWDSLDRFYHSHHADALVARVLDRSGQKQRLPFEVWATLGAVLGSQDMPRRWRTYRGLCLGDEDEIERLKQVNEAVRMDALIAPIASPGYFLAVLDITGARTFTDSDISKIKPLSPMLAALNLNGIDISDLGLRWIGSVASDSDCYRHLQVLSLKGCQRVTNDGVMKVMKLGLRMLGERRVCTYMLVCHAHLSRAFQTSERHPPLVRSRICSTWQLCRLAHAQHGDPRRKESNLNVRKSSSSYSAGHTRCLE